MEQIFGKFYFNKNLAIEFSRFIDFRSLINILLVNKRFNQVYSQDLILWICLQNSFPEIRCAENFLFSDKKGLTTSNASKAFKEVSQCVKQLRECKGFKVSESRHFLVHVQGLLGKLPRSDDIKATSGENFDLLSAFQTFFVFEGEMYALTTYSCPLDKYGDYMINEIDCFLVLGNENLYLSRKDCEETKSLMSSRNLNNVVMLQNTSGLADQAMWAYQMEKEKEKQLEHQGSVQLLRQHIESLNEKVVNIDVLSHHNISLIFNHILKACILKRQNFPKTLQFKDAKLNQDGTYSKKEEDNKTQLQESTKKRCNIF
eukprot:403372182